MLLPHEQRQTKQAGEIPSSGGFVGGFVGQREEDAMSITSVTGEPAILGVVLGTR